MTTNNFDYAVRVLEQQYNEPWVGSFKADHIFGDYAGDTYHKFGDNRVVNHSQVIPLANYYLTKDAG